MMHSWGKQTLFRLAGSLTQRPDGLQRCFATLAARSQP